MEPSSTLELVVALTRQGLYLALLLAAPVVLAATAAGALAAVIQAVTQIREPAASFLLKAIAAVIAVAASGPWLGARLRDFTADAWQLIPALAGSTVP